MMGRQSRQMSMIFVDIESLIPENHLLRKVDRMVSFDFIYRKSQYPVGHPVVKTLVTDGAEGSIRERGCRSRQAA